MEYINKALALVGWGTPHLVAILAAAALSTIVAWVTKVPVRFAWDLARTLSDKVRMLLFRWSVRTLAGMGAFAGAYLGWPERGRAAWLGGFIAWFAVLTLYELTGPLLAKFVPWISTDYWTKFRPIPSDDGADSGV